ncbi:MAG: methylated-DNA--[protein]-cysteine S-methyltransferase [Candidatus Obscuribacterales bacterium]|nr:methylated-DNA--[protein]-cysteine S-methyltransferase [Candidatus Obscuribacterales bacterium]
MTVLYTVLDSPIDPLTLTSDGNSLTGLYMEMHKGVPVADESWVRNDDDELFLLAKRELSAYFNRSLESFTVPIRPTGTEFQMRVWHELTKIPFGRVISYGELAHRIGNPKASRAVGLANGQNPISIIVPCHRVIGASGKLTGYGGGLERKAFLLDLEGSMAAKQLTLVQL